MKTTLLILSFLVSFISFSQDNELKIDSLLNQEISQKSDLNEVGFTRVTCVGFGVRSTAYLFWIDKNFTYIQKLELSEYQKTPITEYKPIKIKDSVFFNYYKMNKEKLKNQFVRRFKYTPKNTELNSVSTGNIQTSHSCYRKFKIRIKNSDFDQTFDFFDLREFDVKKIQASNLTKVEMDNLKEGGWELETDTIYENHPIKNINFDFNKKLKIVEWDKIITDFIQKLESENMFEEYISE